MVRLSRVLRKYVNHFVSFTVIYRDIKSKYDQWLEINSNILSTEQLHQKTMFKSLKEISANKGLTIIQDYIVNNKKWWRIKKLH